MKRRIITILLGLLSLSIGGIIAVQFIWISNAIRVKEELFFAQCFRGVTKDCIASRKPSRCNDYQQNGFSRFDFMVEQEQVASTTNTNRG